MPGRWINKGYIVGKKIVLDEPAEGPFGIVWDFVADAEDGSIPDLPIVGLCRFIFGMEALFGDDIDGEDFFEGADPPNELTSIVKTVNGSAVWSPTKLTDSGFMQPDAPVPVVGGFLISFAQTAAATNGAKGKIIILVG